MKTSQINPLVALGIGIGVGALSLVALIELWPILVIGGGAYLIYKGSSMDSTTQEEKYTNE